MHWLWNSIALQPANHKKAFGFSLADVLIIVAVIVVIGTLLVPRLLRLRLAADEASALDSLRLINTAEFSYSARYPDRGFTCTLASLVESGNGRDRLLDPAVAGGVKDGYRFLLANCGGMPVTSYLVTAVPTAPNHSGVRSFCSDQTGILRYTADSATACTANSRALE